MTIISNCFVLVGALEGESLNLGGHDFIDGEYEFVYIQDGIRTMPSQDDIKLKAIALERNYQAFPKDSKELKDAQERIAGLASLKPGEEPVVPSTPEQREKDEQDARSDKIVTDRNTKTAAREALLKLDPKNDEHWTDGGLPAVEAVRTIAGVTNISRADITALAPNLTRDEATKIAAGA